MDGARYVWAEPWLCCFGRYPDDEVVAAGVGYYNILAREAPCDVSDGSVRTYG